LGSNNPALFRLYNIVGGKSILIQNKIFSKRKLIKAIYSCDQIWILLQSSVSRDPSEIINMLYYTVLSQIWVKY